MFHFPEQLQNERVIRVIRKHPVVYFKIIFALAAVVVLPVGVALYFWFGKFPLSSGSPMAIIGGLVGIMMVLYGLLFTCVAWINEAFDVFIVTNERLVDVTQVGFFNRQVAAAPLFHIEDTTSQVQGFFPTLLNYGSVTVKTAAGLPTDFYMDYVRDPAMVAKLLLDWVHQKRDHGDVNVDFFED